jgi:hypothetical protein
MHNSVAFKQCSLLSRGLGLLYGYMQVGFSTRGEEYSQVLLTSIMKYKFNLLVTKILSPVDY